MAPTWQRMQADNTFYQASLGNSVARLLLVTSCIGILSVDSINLPPADAQPDWHVLKSRSASEEKEADHGEAVYAVGVDVDKRSLRVGHFEQPSSSAYEELLSRLDKIQRQLGTLGGPHGERISRVFDRHGRVLTSGDATPASPETAAGKERQLERLADLLTSDRELTDPAASTTDNAPLESILVNLLDLVGDLLQAWQVDKAEMQKSLDLLTSVAQVLVKYHVPQ